MVYGFSYGAQGLVLRGKVVNSENQAIQGASIYLLSSGSNVLLKTAVSDSLGSYFFNEPPKGNFVVSISVVGYEKYTSAAFEINDKSLDLPLAQLAIASKSVGEVTVEGKVPLVQQRDGKLILNVENSSIAAGNNALEIVKRAPGVSVDKDENLQLMGQGGMNVTIDGRQTFMSGDQLATFLKSMSGDQIKSIEVSTSRSAKDDAEGAVGTINIVLKKNRIEGFNGTFLASAGYGEHFRGNSSLSLNYKKNNTTVFGSYGYTESKRQFDLNLQRLVASQTGDKFFDQEAALVEKNKTHNYRFGISQKTSERNNMSFQFTGDNDAESSLNSSLTNMGAKQGQVDSILTTKTVSSSPFNRYSANFNNEFLLDTLGGKLTLDLDWSAFRNSSIINYDYTTTFANGSLVHPLEQERSSMPVDIDIYVAKLDFAKKLGKGNLESGLKYSHVKSDNDLQFEHFVDDKWQEFAGRPNHFQYTEQIAAGYVDYGQVMGKFSMKLGLRGEYTLSDGNSITLNNRVERSYFDFFPSANLGYTINENNILSLSYARKISRPNYRFLNPFEYFIDKYTSQRGNAYLKPQYTDGIALNYTLKKMFNISLGTDITNDAMLESLGQDTLTGKAWITRDNLGKTITTYLNVNAPFQITKFWSSNTNLTTIYMHFKGPIGQDYINQGSVFFQGRSMHNFKFSQALSGELSINYNSPFLYNVYKIHGRWGTDVGINYNFKDGRSSLKIAGTDIFKTQKNNVSTEFGEFNSSFKQYNDNRSIRLTYTYKFGNLKQRINKNDTNNEEKSRAQ